MINLHTLDQKGICKHCKQLKINCSCINGKVKALRERNARLIKELDEVLLE